MKKITTIREKIVLHKYIRCNRTEPRDTSYLIGLILAAAKSELTSFYNMGIDYVRLFLIEE